MNTSTVTPAACAAEDRAASGKGRSPAAAEEGRSPGRDALDNYANKVNRLAESVASLTAEKRLVERTEKAYKRALARQISVIPRVRKCGHTVRRAAGVGIVADLNAAAGDRVAGFRGLYTCASVWSCPRCQPIIARERFLEVRAAMEQWISSGAVLTKYSKGTTGVWWSSPEGEPDVLGPAAYVDAATGEPVWPGVNDQYLDHTSGELVERKLRSFDFIRTPDEHAPGRVAFLTLTMRHQRRRKSGDKWGAAPIWDGLTGAFSRFTNDKFFKANIPAYVRTAEVTHSEKTGWHIHLHVALFVSHGFAAELKKNRETIFQAWVRAVEKTGYTADGLGQDLTLVTDTEADAGRLASYVTKGNTKSTEGLAHELTGMATKRAAGSSVTIEEMRDYLLQNRPQMCEGKIDTERLLKGLSLEALSLPEKTLLLHREFERAAHGRRWMTWSRGAKEAFGLLESTDDEITDIEDGAEEGEEGEISIDKGTAEIAGFHDFAVWNKFARVLSNPIELRALVEKGDAKEVMNNLAAWADYYELDVKIGQDWSDHLEKTEQEQEKAELLEATYKATEQAEEIKALTEYAVENMLSWAQVPMGFSRGLNPWQSRDK